VGGNGLEGIDGTLAGDAILLVGELLLQKFKYSVCRLADCGILRAGGV
jgi:hypothetical protein